MPDPRLLSPMRRRIYPNAKTGTAIEKAGPLVQALRANLQPGQPDMMTWMGLKKLGWTEYAGPGVTDERGYIVPGSDPAVIS